MHHYRTIQYLISKSVNIDIKFSTSGTDRSNLLLMSDPGLNYPQSIEKSMDFWEGVKSLNHPEATSKDIAIGLATAGYYCGKYQY